MRKLLLLALIVTVLAGIIIFVFPNRKNNMIYGVSFSPEYTNFLGFDYKKVFEKILDEWNFRHIRLFAQWNMIEKKQGEFDFSNLDWMIGEAQKRNARIMLAVGQKTPRWPECHLPGWLDKKEYAKNREPLINFISTVVQRYKDNEALEYWQVENEPFLKFGACEPLTGKELADEIQLVKDLDGVHPIIITDSGELSTWRKTAKAADLFGTTMYRVVWSKSIGYWSYNWMPAFVYTAKLWLNGRSSASAFITELQAEPWIPDRDLKHTSVDEQFKSMSIKQLKKNLTYAAKTGMPRAYLWGAEWWYWLEVQGVGEFAEYIKNLKKE